MLGLGLSVDRQPYVGGWTPSDLSGLVGWYRFNTGIHKLGTTTFPVNGEDVGRWVDQSGNGNDATKSSNVPSYNSTLSSIFFDSTAETLDIPQLTLGEFSIYIRLRFTDTTITTGDILVKDDTSANNFWRIQGTTQIRCKIGGSASINYTLHSSIILNENVSYNMGLERDSGSAMSSYLEGVANGASTIIDLGDNPFLVDSIHGGVDAVISEVIITTTSLTSEERELVDKWLSSETPG